MAKARLGSLTASVRGSIGGLVLLDGRDGAVVRAKPTYRRPTSPAQRASEARMRAASAVWSSFSAGEVAVWRAWGEPRGMTPQTAFVALATKLLQIDPLAAVPRTPPAADFVEDDVAVSIAGSPSFHSGERKGAGDGESGAPALSPLPPSLAGERGGTGVRFVARGATRRGSLVEIVMQRLPNERRSPTKDYASAAFAAFPEGGAGFFLSLPPGVYAFGTRVVDARTGQQAPLRRLGVTTVA